MLIMRFEAPSTLGLILPKTGIIVSSGLACQGRIGAHYFLIL